MACSSNSASKRHSKARHGTRLHLCPTLSVVIPHWEASDHPVTKADAKDYQWLIVFIGHCAQKTDKARCIMYSWVITNSTPMEMRSSSQQVSVTSAKPFSDLLSHDSTSSAPAFHFPSVALRVIPFQSKNWHLRSPVFTTQFPDLALSLCPLPVVLQRNAPELSCLQ